MGSAPLGLAAVNLEKRMYRPPDGILLDTPAPRSHGSGALPSAKPSRFPASTGGGLPVSTGQRIQPQPSTA